MQRPTSSSRRRVSLAAAVLVVLAGRAFTSAAATADPAPLPAALATGEVTRMAGAETAAYDGVVQAVRQTVVASQVPGAVVALHVQAGDRVKAGQLLMRLDARAAEQTAAAGAAQVDAARAAQEAAAKELDRQRRLFEQNFISRAALDRFESQARATQAEAAAQRASAGAARTQSGFYVVKAPYDGVVSEVAVVLGDMAMPGRTLVTVHDPAALRVSAAIPQSVAARLSRDALPLAELPGAGGAKIRPVRSLLLPSVDPATHTLELRLDLPAGIAAAPGMFARAWLPLTGGGDARLSIPARAVLRRAEMSGVYVIAADGRPLLRQVRLGRAEGERVEVLSGVSAGERVALDPQAAARVR